jgi:hypothetical protein
MKVTLAIVLVVLACGGRNAAGRVPSPPQSPPAAQAQQPAASEAGSQQPENPPVSKPCAESKDTCELEPAPQSPTSSTNVKTEQPPQAKPLAKAAVHSKKSRRHKTVKKQVATSDPALPKKTVVRHGGTSDPAVVLTPGGTTRGNFTPQMTADLLSATDANLKEATTKPLTATEEETVNQIKLFMEQANAAVKAGDLDRGHNLAIKAHLLSDDLVKR